MLCDAFFSFNATDNIYFSQIFIGIYICFSAEGVCREIEKTSSGWRGYDREMSVQWPRCYHGMAVNDYEITLEKLYLTTSKQELYYSHLLTSALHLKVFLFDNRKAKNKARKSRKEWNLFCKTYRSQQQILLICYWLKNVHFRVNAMDKQ